MTEEQPRPNKLKSRKLWTALLAQFVHVLLLVNGHIEPQHFETLTLFTFAGWFGGEANEKWAQR